MSTPPTARTADGTIVNLHEIRYAGAATAYAQVARLLGRHPDRTDAILAAVRDMHKVAAAKAGSEYTEDVGHTPGP